MAEPNLIAILGPICEIEPPEITGQGIGESDNRIAFERFIGLGALVHVGDTASVICLGCDQPHSITVEYGPGGRYRAYCPEAGYQPVSASELRTFAVSEEWIARSVGAHLGNTTAPGSGQGAPTLVTQIGRFRFKQYVCQLFFARRLGDRARFEQSKERIQNLTGKCPSILLTTTPADQIPGEPPTRCAIIALEDVLEITVNQTSLNEEPIYAALRGRRPQCDGIGYSFSSGFRSAVFGDQEYSFTDKQALAVEALYEAWRTGTGRLHQTEVQSAANTPQRVVNLFRRHPAYGALIKAEGSAYYRLDL